MKRLLVFQSMWAMERRHTDGIERSLDENVKMIAEAGFDGVSAHWRVRDDVRQARSKARICHSEPARPQARCAQRL